MSTTFEWLEPLTIPVGGEATWQEGGLRLWLDTLSGGCLTPREDWYGPFVERGDGYEPISQ